MRSPRGTVSDSTIHRCGVQSTGSFYRSSHVCPSITNTIPTVTGWSLTASIFYRQVMKQPSRIMILIMAVDGAAKTVACQCFALCCSSIGTAGRAESILFSELLLIIRKPYLQTLWYFLGWSNLTVLYASIGPWSSKRSGPPNMGHISKCRGMDRYGYGYQRS